MKKIKNKQLRNRIAKLQVEIMTAPTNYVKADLMKQLAACHAELEKQKENKHHQKWDDEDEDDYIGGY